MTAKQRFVALILLVILVVAGIVGTVVSVIIDGVNATNSPSVAFITGTGTAVILVLIGIIQNQSIQQTVTETKSIVNGGLAQRIDDGVRAVLTDLGIDHPAPVAPTTSVDTNAKPMNAGT